MSNTVSQVGSITISLGGGVVVFTVDGVPEKVIGAVVFFIGLAVFISILEYANKSSGSVSVSHAGENILQKPDGKYCPAPGYQWLNSIESDFRVVWSPGMEHTGINNVIAATKEGTWRPTEGYTWAKDDPGDFRVRHL